MSVKLGALQEEVYSAVAGDEAHVVPRVELRLQTSNTDGKT
jgi:hypothetical protein